VSCKNETKAGLTNSTTQFKLENFVHERTEQFYLGFSIGLILTNFSDSWICILK